MFNRAQLKQKAKQNISKNLLYCIGICFVASFLMSDWFGIYFDVSSTNPIPMFRMGLGTNSELSFDFIRVALPNVGLVSLVSLAAFAYSILVKGPIEVGMAYFFLRNRQEASKLEALFEMFQRGYYWNIVKTMLLRNIYITLWTFLFFFPGIYKAYQYYMIPYILAENPEMDASDVFELTKLLTKNIKLEIFILEVSFFGWILAGAFTCGILFLYAIPYQYATFAELYIFLRDKAIDDGKIEPIQPKESEEEKNVGPTIKDFS